MLLMCCCARRDGAALVGAVDTPYTPAAVRLGAVDTPYTPAAVIDFVFECMVMSPILQYTITNLQA
jgi:hypothetical protein